MSTGNIVKVRTFMPVSVWVEGIYHGKKNEVE